MLYSNSVQRNSVILALLLDGLCKCSIFLDSLFLVVFHNRHGNTIADLQEFLRECELYEREGQSAAIKENDLLLSGWMDSPACCLLLCLSGASPSSPIFDDPQRRRQGQDKRGNSLILLLQIEWNDPFASCRSRRRR